MARVRATSGSGNPNLQHTAFRRPYTAVPVQAARFCPAVTRYLIGGDQILTCRAAGAVPALLIFEGRSLSVPTPVLARSAHLDCCFRIFPCLSGVPAVHGAVEDSLAGYQTERALFRLGCSTFIGQVPQTVYIWPVPQWRTQAIKSFSVEASRTSRLPPTGRHHKVRIDYAESDQIFCALVHQRGPYTQNHVS